MLLIPPGNALPHFTTIISLPQKAKIKDLPVGRSSMIE
jgi:hypothetical protein